MSLTRKEFLGTVLTGTAAFALLGACSGDDEGPADAAVGGPDSAPPTIDASGPTIDSAPGTPDADTTDATPTSCVDNGTNVLIGTNHSHTMTVSKQDVSAGADKTYDITGTSGHSHNVTVTAAQFAMLAANQSVQVTSTTVNTHSHVVTITCA